MPKFKVTVERDVVISARNAREAANKVFLSDGENGRLPVSVNGRYIADHCESCSVILFGDEEYHKDKDGMCSLCVKCFRKMIKMIKSHDD